MDTKVLIIGREPSGLLLSLLLTKNDIDNVILEKNSALHVANRIRAGILEPGTVKILKKAGVGKRLSKEGITHSGFNISFNDQIYHINMKKLANDTVTVYGQTEVTKDLMDKLAKINTKIFYKANDIKILNITKPKIEFMHNSKKIKINSQFIVGCDGYHGITKNFIPKNIKKIYEKEYSFAWLGLLSDTKPISRELIYINSPNGFGLCSMRSKTRSRYYIQCSNKEKIKDWSDDRFWENLYKTLPSDIKVVYKEHPGRFHGFSKGSLYKNSEYYERLKKYNFLEFTSFKSNSINLIDNSIGVLSSSSTAGWEAITRDKPCILFGSIWYQSCSEILKVENLDQMKKAL